MLIAGLLALAPAPAPAQAPAPGTPEAPARPAPEPPTTDAPEAETLRARIQARLGLVEEALAAYRALLARYPDDRRLREDYVEVMVDAGLLDQAAPLVDRYLADDRPPRACAACARGSTWPSAPPRPRAGASTRSRASSPRTRGSPPTSPPRSWPRGGGTARSTCTGACSTAIPRTATRSPPIATSSAGTRRASS